LGRRGVEPAPCLVRAAVIEPVRQHRRGETWKRWERGAPMELWQLDVVGGRRDAAGD